MLFLYRIIGPSCGLEQTWGARVIQLLARGVHRHGAFQTATGERAGWAPILSAPGRKLSICIAQEFADTEVGAGAVRSVGQEINGLSGPEVRAQPD